MNPHVFISSLVFVCLLSSPISALPHFFPNISSIPPSLIPNTSAGAWDSFRNLLGNHAGGKVSGLAKLKDYLRHFGYINNSFTNFTDDFDGALETAIKTYQLNFNLNVTGELDEATVKQILLPRCGVADVVNETSSMNSGKSPIHLGTVAHYSFFPGSPRWPESKTELTYAFLPENQLADSVKVVFSHAFERWTEVTPFTFTETASFSTADIRIGFFIGDHGDGEPFDGVLGTLGHAFSPPNGRLHLDGDENWVIDGGVTALPVMYGVDLESVAVHEIGHLLGLGHSSVEEAIMFPTISSGVRKVELAGDDILGIQVLYGSYNDSLPPMATAQERDPSGAYFVGPAFSQVLFFTVGLVLLVS